MSSVRLENVYKIYPNGAKAVKDFNLNIEDEEFIVFVGPSGCGKSTTLRMIAGLEDISAGRVYIDDCLVNDMEPKDRDISMVFQNYALYPNMTVYDNMAYGLRCQSIKCEVPEIDFKAFDLISWGIKCILMARARNKEKEKLIRQAILPAAEILGITEYLDRKPKELSGGQRQRVALGRAIVRHPKVFLLDEPLSNLDAKLRVQMRSEITKLHERLGTTFIYVTHDQTEAMTMGSRIVVMKDGVVQQVDTPLNLYEHPENTFVATFLGSPQMNLLSGAISIKDGKTYFVSDDLEIEIKDDELLETNPLTDGLEIYLGIRPKDIHISNKGYKVKIELTEQLGSETIIYVKLPGKEELSTITVSDTSILYRNGQEIFISFDNKKLHFFDKKTEESLRKANVSNKISVNLEEVNGKLRLEDNELSDEFKSHILKDYRGLVDLSISSDDISLDKCDNSISLNAKVTKVIKYSTYNVVFATLKNNQKIVFKATKDIVDENVKIYIPLSSVEIYDIYSKKIYSRLIEGNSNLLEASVIKTKSSTILTLNEKVSLKNKMFKVIDNEIVNNKLVLKLTGVKEIINNKEAYKENIILSTDVCDIFTGQFVFVK